MREWCGSLVLPGGCDRPRRRGCMSVERSGSCFRAGECRRLSANNEIGGELTVEAVLLNLSGATFLRRVLEVVPCDWASL